MSEGLGDYIGANPSAEYITREAAFRILFRALSDPRGENWNRIRHSVREIPVAYQLPFHDTHLITVHEPAILSLWQHGIVTGNPKGFLHPGSYIRREDVAFILFNAGTPLGALLDGVEVLRPNVAVGFEPLTIAAGAFSGYLDSRSNHQGAQAFRFLVTESGDYTFTASSAGAPFTPFAPMLFDAVARPGVIPVEIEFPPIHIIPERYERAGSLRNYFRVRTYLNRGTMVVVAVSGSADTDFRIMVEREVPDIFWPIPAVHNVNSHFGRRQINNRCAAFRQGNCPGFPNCVTYPNPCTRSRGYHMGIDMTAATGTHIYAAMCGRVVRTGYNLDGWGHFIEIEHRDGFRTLYAHLVSGGVRVADDEEVRAGQLIGLSGNSGRSYAPHLHFEFIRPALSENRINPLSSYHRYSHRRNQFNANSLFVQIAGEYVFNPDFDWGMAKSYNYPRTNSWTDIDG